MHKASLGRIEVKSVVMLHYVRALVVDGLRLVVRKGLSIPIQIMNV